MKFIATLLINFLLGSILSGQIDLVWETKLDSCTPLSSPQSYDFNQDGISDYVFGAGLENSTTPSGIFVINGVDGSVIWKQKSTSHLFGTPHLDYVDEDEIKDIYINGRNGQFLCLSGKDGNIIWSLELSNDTLQGRLANITAPIFINDVTNDSVSELIAFHRGAIRTDEFGNITKTLNSNLFIINGANGELIQNLVIPNNSEIYFNPVNYQYEDMTKIFFGTGGERHAGELLSLDLHDILNGIISLDTIISTKDKGFIQPASLVELNHDSVPELIVPGMNGTIYLIDGKTQSIIDSLHYDGYECYNAPIIGFYNNDCTPDISLTINQGEWPSYLSHKTIIIDGSNFNVLNEINHGQINLNSGCSYDLDNDGIDEIISITNYLNNNKWYHSLYSFNQTSSQLDTLFTDTGSHFMMTPLIDQNEKTGATNLIYYNFGITDTWYPNSLENSFIYLKKFDFNSSNTVNWKSYMGNSTDGYFQPNDSIVRFVSLDTVVGYSSEDFPLIYTPEDASVSSNIFSPIDKGTGIHYENSSKRNT